MKAYSIDLRKRVVNAVDRAEGTLEEIAEIFSVGMTFIKKLLRQRRETGSIEPLPHGGGQTPLLDAEKEALVKIYVLENPDAALEEICDYLEKKTKLRVSLPTMCRVLQKLDLRRKKKLYRRKKRMKSREKSFAKR